MRRLLTSLLLLALAAPGLGARPGIVLELLAARGRAWVRGAGASAAVRPGSARGLRTGAWAAGRVRRRRQPGRPPRLRRLLRQPRRRLGRDRGLLARRRHRRAELRRLRDRHRRRRAARHGWLLRQRRRAARRERPRRQPRRPARLRHVAHLERHRLVRARRGDGRARADRLHQGVPARGSLSRGLRRRAHLGRRGERGRQARLRHRRQPGRGQRVLARPRQRRPRADHVRERERLRRVVHGRHRAHRRLERHDRARRQPGLRHRGGDRRGHGLRARRRDRPPDAAELPARSGPSGWVVQERAGAGGRGGERDQPRRQDPVRGQRGRRGARAVLPRRGDRRADPVVVLRAPGADGRRGRR